MAIVEYEGKKYDTVFEFETVRDNANSLMCKCVKIKSNPATTDEEREELCAIIHDMSDLEQSFEMVDDLPLILQTQEKLRKLSAELTQKYDGR